MQVDERPMTEGPTLPRDAAGNLKCPLCAYGCKEEVNLRGHMRIRHNWKFRGTPAPTPAQAPTSPSPSAPKAPPADGGWADIKAAMMRADWHLPTLAEELEDAAERIGLAGPAGIAAALAAALFAFTHADPDARMRAVVIGVGGTYQRPRGLSSVNT